MRILSKEATELSEAPENEREKKMKWIFEDVGITCDKCGFTLDPDFEIKKNVVSRFKFCPNCGEQVSTIKRKDAYTAGIKVCPVCKKKFIPAAKHIYHISEAGRYKKVCSWSCQRK